MSGADGAAPGPVLDLAHLRVAFDGVGEVLHGVSLRVAPGECVAVVGESGAGKSVLARAVVGLASEGGSTARASAERFRLRGRDALGFGRRDWRGVRGRDVGFVLQDALGSLDPLRTVGAEVGEALALRRVGRAEREQRVQRALHDVGLPDPRVRAAQRPGELSGGMRQRALIASALVVGPPLLVADEPTTALDATVAVRVLDLLARLRDAGTALLLVTHDLGAVSRVADRVVVLERGLVVEEGSAAQVLTDPRRPYTQRLVAAVPRGPKRAAAVGAPGSGHDPSSSGQAVPVLRARGLARAYRLPGGGTVRAVDHVDVDVLPGEALGIVGESGSGKTTLARLLLAAEAPDAGEVTLDGDAWSSASERERRRRRGRIRFIAQDPLRTFDPRHTAGRILTDALGLARARGDGRPREASARTPAELLGQVRLPASVLTRRPRSLSGGQRQRLAIARALAADPEVLVCDEPVSALDVTVQAEILDLLVSLQHERGMAIVFISHDLAVVRTVCDTVAVMRAGRIIERGPVEGVFANPEHEFTRELLAAATPQ